MLKKILAIILIITVSLFISNYVFAEERSMMDNAKNAVNNVMHDAQNVVNDATDGMKNVTNNVENNVNNATNDIRNTIDNTTDNITTNENNQNDIIDNGAVMGDDYVNGSYSAARTTATDTNTNPTSYLWIVLAIAALVVIGAIWYYATRVTNDNDNYHNK